MGKSRAKTKAMKIGGRRDSDKKDRSLANRMFRRRTKAALKSGYEEKLPQTLRDVSDTWNFSSDGLAIYNKDLGEKYMRK